MALTRALSTRCVSTRGSPRASVKVQIGALCAVVPDAMQFVSSSRPRAPSPTALASTECATGSARCALRTEFELHDLICCAPAEVRRRSVGSRDSYSLDGSELTMCATCGCRRRFSGDHAGRRRHHHQHPHDTSTPRPLPEHAPTTTTFSAHRTVSLEQKVLAKNISSRAEREWLAERTISR